MTGFGGGGWGGMPWGGSDDDAGVSALAFTQRENAVRLVFSDPLHATGLLDPNDSLNPSLYGIAVEGGVGLDGEPARPVAVVAVELPVPGDTTQIDLVLDRRMTHYPASYLVTVAGAVTALGDSFYLELQVDGVCQFFPPPTIENAVVSRDLANPQVLSALKDGDLPDGSVSDDRLLGTFPKDSTGDYASDSGTVSYRKRCIRRLSTKRGTYAHLPRNYGMSLLDQIKQLFRTGQISSVVAEAEDQIRLEPETVTVTVVATFESGALHLRVRAMTKSGPANFGVKVPI